MDQALRGGGKRSTEYPSNVSIIFICEPGSFKSGVMNNDPLQKRLKLILQFFF